MQINSANHFLIKEYQQNLVKHQNTLLISNIKTMAARNLPSNKCYMLSINIIFCSNAKCNTSHFFQMLFQYKHFNFSFASDIIPKIPSPVHFKFWSNDF